MYTNFHMYITFHLYINYYLDITSHLYLVPIPRFISYVLRAQDLDHLYVYEEVHDRYLPIQQYGLQTTNFSLNGVTFSFGTYGPLAAGFALSFTTLELNLYGVAGFPRCLVWDYFIGYGLQNRFVAASIPYFSVNYRFDPAQFNVSERCPTYVVPPPNVFTPLPPDGATFRPPVGVSSTSVDDSSTPESTDAMGSPTTTPSPGGSTVGSSTTEVREDTGTTGVGGVPGGEGSTETGQDDTTAPSTTIEQIGEVLVTSDTPLVTSDNPLVTSDNSQVTVGPPGSGSSGFTSVDPGLTSGSGGEEQATNSPDNGDNGDNGPIEDDQPISGE